MTSSWLSNVYKSLIHSMLFMRVIASLFRHRGYIWMPTYLPRQWSRHHLEHSKHENVHVMVLFVDHFEPSRREGRLGVEKVRTWCERYEAIARSHKDSDGVHPKHSWFYRYDYPSYECVNILSQSAHKGFGEIEFHLHHGHDTPDSFAQKLHDGVAWFNQVGAMISAEDGLQRRFGYIAGNWALDNGRRDASMSGVNTELVILGKAGCYADFTFPAFGTNAQPRKVNSIYYSKDTPKPKSYNTGIDVAVGKTPSGDLMIFEGPLYVDWEKGFIDYAALESYAPYFPKRLDYWLDANIHVLGRPNWIFIKLHTHGMQSADYLFEHQLSRLFSDLEDRFTQDFFRLHYVTAREAYNIVKAAEEQKSGDPNDYRDFCIGKPVNTHVYCNKPYCVQTYSNNQLALQIETRNADTEIAFRNLPIKSVKGGQITSLELIHDGVSLKKLKIEGAGDSVVCQTSGRGPAIRQECRLPFTRCY
jgi:hypothetical protein